MKPLEPPVELGKIYEVTIEARGGKGDGIAHYEGFVIFVRKAEVGKAVKVRITALHRTFAFAELL